ncbi:MAG: DUF6666 family protein [Planctomycetota bacterium]
MHADQCLNRKMVRVVAVWLAIAGVCLTLPANAQEFFREFGFTPKHQREATRGNLNPNGAPMDAYWEGAVTHGEPLEFSPDSSEPLVEFAEEADVDWLVDTETIWRRNVWEIGGGVQGFTGPLNQGLSGSFGFHEVVNFGSTVPVWGCGDIGWQVGARAIQANLSDTVFSTDSRHQVFATAGLFHRVDRGIQWGLVVDWLRDDWYDQLDLRQVRGELGWKPTCWHELGVAFATGNDRQAVSFTPPGLGATAQSATFTTADWYALYGRRRFGKHEAGEARILAGLTDQSDGLIGGDLRAPLLNDWSLTASFTYLFPQVDAPVGSQASYAQEVWNVAIGFVWTPGISAARNYERPLLNVADNGTLLMRRP